jgi:hypothetical protein
MTLVMIDRNILRLFSRTIYGDAGVIVVASPWHSNRNVDLDKALGCPQGRPSEGISQAQDRAVGAPVAKQPPTPWIGGC